MSEAKSAREHAEPLPTEPTGQPAVPPHHEPTRSPNPARIRWAVLPARILHVRLQHLPQPPRQRPFLHAYVPLPRDPARHLDQRSRVRLHHV